MVTYTKNPLINDTIPKTIESLIADDISHYLVIKDGHILAKDIDIEGLYIDNFDNALSDKIDVIQKIDDTKTDVSDAFKYVKENATSGIFVHVQKNTVIEPPLHVFVLQEEHDMVHNTIVVCDENSQLNYMEYYQNEQPSSNNIVNQAIVNENAKLTYTTMNLFTQKSVLDVNRQGLVKRYGTLTFNNAEVSDALSNVNTVVKLVAPYAKSYVKTVAITNQQQEARFEQLVEHLAQYTEGYIENYGVSSDTSALVFEGVGKIHKNMKHSIARQQNRGIVLSRKARLDANPLLLIDEYDVIASHGAAIGKIDEEQLYYLMSRGLTKRNAERLIINGFLNPILDALSSDKLKTLFIDSVARKTQDL
ncbi:MAG: SufD family Fe-S cluster assembly protein [Candidatus Izimaplasma sp.]|nr:SufD family Fe-S cluster assembly protein [Candidatus Izimaplasma bacterium]